MDRYRDIINLPHKQSEKRLHMTLHDRAAQFSPFAALNGHEDAIEETARLTDGRVVLGEYEAQTLDEKLRELIKEPMRNVRVTYFEPDGKKQGGKYLTFEGEVRRVDVPMSKICFAGRTEIRFGDIIGIELL